MNPVLFSADYLLQCFSQNYTTAHERFSRLAQAKNRQYREYVYPQTGPEGEKLVTATLLRGNPDASHLLVIQSATHGAEGFAGSAIQLDHLQRNAQLDNELAVLYIHAFNPYGFAWLRRVNEDGIDLNRNFIDFSQPLPVNTEYAQLANAILPANDDWKRADHELSTYRHAHGQQALELAITGGQYAFPEGLFYGGDKPSLAQQHLERIFRDYQLHARKKIAVIDIHTGLGPFGYGELICDHPPDSNATGWAKQWYGQSITEPFLGTSSSVPKLGLVDYYWQQQLPERVCFVTLEFGTHDVRHMLQALRQDHWLHRKPVDWQATETQRIKKQMRDFFYPATADWQEMVLMRGRQVIGQALQGLRS